MEKTVSRIWPVSPFLHFWRGFGLFHFLHNLEIGEIDGICVHLPNCRHGL